MKDHSQKLAAIAAVQPTSTFKEMMEALKLHGEKISSRVNRAMRKHTKSKVGKLVLAIICQLLVLAAATASCFGGNYLSAGTWWLGIAFFIFDSVIIWRMYAKKMHWGWKIACLAFELASFVYYAYGTNGFIGKTRAGNEATKLVQSEYRIVSEHYENAAKIYSSIRTVRATADSLADYEKKYNHGTGIIFGMAHLVAIAKDATVPPAIKIEPLSSADYPTLEDLNDEVANIHNQFLSAIVRYDTYASTIKGNADAILKGWNNATMGKLNPTQQKDLVELKSLLGEIVSHKFPTSTLPKTAASVKPADFEKNPLLGYALGILPILLMTLLAFSKDGDDESGKSFEELKELQLKTMAEDILSSEGISYDMNDKAVKDLSARRILEMVNAIINSENLLEYLTSRNATFEGWVAFENAYPTLAQQAELNKWKWHLSEILAELERNPGFIDIAADAVTMPKGEWKLLNEMFTQPELIFEAHPYQRARLTRLIKHLGAQSQLEGDALKKFVSQFLGLGVGNYVDRYFKNLEIAGTIDDPAKVRVLTRKFLAAVNSNIFEKIATKVAGVKFTTMVAGWTDQLDKNFTAFINDDTINKARQFNYFVEVALKNGGIEAVEAVANSYSQQKAEVQDAGGSKSLVFDADFEAISDALSSGSQAKINDAFANVISIKAIRVTI